MVKTTDHIVNEVSMTTSIQPRKSNLREVIGGLDLIEGHLSKMISMTLLMT